MNLRAGSILTLLGVLLVSLPATAMARTDSLSVADSLEAVRLHEFGRAPVASCPLNLTGDTLDTADPDIRIVLLPDHSWHVVRNPEALKDDPNITECWNTQSVDPYRLSLDALPYSWEIWVLDSLSQYHCPNQVAVYSPYGFRHGRQHQGVDLPLKTGDPVYAAFDGKVRISAYTGGYGNLIVLRHANGLETFYGHLSKSNVKSGEWVHAGQVIGLGGSTGRSTGPHLHFETRYKGYSFDPQRLIDFKTGTLRHRLFTLRKRYFDANSKYVPSDDDEDIIAKGDAEDYKRAEEERKKAEAAQQQWHRIRSGDTLSGIAKKYHTTVNAICKLNKGLKPTTTLQIGKSIRVR